MNCVDPPAGGAQFSAPAVTTLNVNGLTTNIAPGSGTAGVSLSAGPDNGGNGGSGLFGGDGDNGQIGADVTVNHVGGAFSIIGTNAPGIHAVSRGGSGGSGGDGIGLIATPGIGGDGGDGGAGGTVTITSSGVISTTGDRAHGILGESIGGNGGQGGDGTGASVYAKGGNGGDAAGGGTVFIDTSSNITTNGTSAHGIFGQSTGGKGGAGGDGFGIVADWGPGGTTAAGGEIFVTSSGAIETLGTYSYGIFAQSVGGFGGDSGGGGGLVAFGEDAGSAGPGGAVHVTNSGTIDTHLIGSHAIFAQSVGGGGGSGGSGGGLVALGAGGTTGGAGGAVTVTNNGPGHLETRGVNAKGIFAQSIGGGGGDGGNSGGLVSIGGSGSSTSSGGVVTVINSQAITTHGDRADAIYGQSIGGGGGSAGVSGGLVSIGGSGGGGGDGETVDITNSGELITSGTFARGIFAQSVGGGGGDGGFSGGLVSIGGSGAEGGRGKKVSVDNSGAITTEGDDSAAIFAQSVGGGGGAGGNSLGVGVFVTVAVGGGGGKGGAGGDVAVNEGNNAGSAAARIETMGDRSAGILAQSVGGGGGTGGFAIGAAGAPYGNVTLTFGGSGGDGGDGGVVFVGANGEIFTRGSFSSGIVAESIGGGGGSGGFTVAVSASTGGSVALGMGGTGGKGGAGGTVDVNNFARIQTGCADCTQSHGILASSIGGGGGSGGFAISGSAALVGSLSLGFGGTGGEGNTGGTVNVVSNITDAAGIRTDGDMSHGILAQSIGGGGGNGGFSVALGVAIQGPAASLAFGGDGGEGAMGGVVTVDNTGNITTSGDGSNGILAQSIGGGGGTGGFSGSLAFSVQGAAGAASFGGSGGEGSEGNDVTVHHSGDIRTTGNNAVGILAQSIGGGGGTGGFSIGAAGSIKSTAAVMSLGGEGGAGGGSGTVTVTDVFGSIVTTSEQSHGILAQSVAGGGGSGGFSIGASFSLQSDSYANAVGGGGGTAQNAGDVIVVNDAAITTGGDFVMFGGRPVAMGVGSHGILAQSIGGGGGTGGFSGAIAISFEGDASASTTGGDGAGGGDGGSVDVTSNGVIVTRADNSIGVFAQSVGGGGGNGAFSIGVGGSVKSDADTKSVGGKAGAAGGGGEVTVAINNHITTFGALSHGVLAQSVGGGGGNGGFSIGFGGSLEGDSKVDSVGGDGSGGGDGGAVTVTVGTEDDLLFPLIQTFGDGAAGVFAQSVGGGGGSGGFSGGLSLAIDGAAENKVGGGGGGAGGAGGDVHVTNFGTITTQGANAAGVFAQSVGGGGGSGGFSIAASLGDSKAVANSVGGDGSGGGDGGNVRVDNFGYIETQGAFSHGIIAQSVGGGGGNGGFAIAAGVTMSGDDGSSKVGGGGGGAGGNGGVVTVNNDGAIIVHGDNAFGIFAQSVGGGGGSGGIAGGLAINGKMESAVGGDGGAGGNGGDVTVTSNGSITTTGANASAVFAQSVGGSGGWGGLAIGIGTGAGESDGVTLSLGSKSITETCLSWQFAECLPTGGTQGIVTVTINGETTVTSGNLAYGLLAQAIGGGGGAMGTVMGALSFFGSDVVVDLGSNGALSEDGQAVVVTYGNPTTTTGLGSIGHIAQSIGGGGGVNAMTAEELELNPNGEDSFILSVGGYSEGAGFDGTGSGGGFELTAEGTVTTENHNAIGIVAQTIGGGGGIGTISVESIVNDGKLLDIRLGGSQRTDAAFVGDGGPASTLTAQEKVTTSGALSHGIVSQSIGGGGGIANVVFLNGLVLGDGVDIVIGSGAGGAGGNGGHQTVTAHGVETGGAGAMGIVVQSIGGGGGLTGVYAGGLLLGQDGFSLTPVAIAAGEATEGGNGGDATLYSYGSVRTDGYGAHGIVVQSIAGGGGIVGSGMFGADLADPGLGAFAGSVGKPGTAGAVSIIQTGNVVVAGEDSVGIYGQSAGGTANGAVDIVIDWNGPQGNGIGLVWAADGSGAAVQFADGLDNTLSTNGTLYAQGSLATPDVLPMLGGLAILGGSGNEDVFNRARGPGFVDDYALTGGVTRTSNIIGNVDLGGGLNNLTNEAGALFISDAFVNLGTGGYLTNQGFLAPGDRGRVRTTAIGSHLALADSGFYYIDIDLNQQNVDDTKVTDLITVDETATVDGGGPLLLLSINKAFSDAGYVIVHADGGVTDLGFTPTLTPPAVGFIFSVDVQANPVIGDDLVLLAEKPPFLDLLQDPASGTTDPNVWRMGEGIDAIEQAIDVDDPFNYLVNLLRLQPDHEALGDAVVTLTPHQAPHLFTMTQQRAAEFLDLAGACPADRIDPTGKRRDCVWGDFSGGEYRRGVVQDSPINEDDWRSLAFGAQGALDDRWAAGFVVGTSETSSTQLRDGEPLSDLKGNIHSASVSADYRDGPFGMTFVAAGSYGAWRARRHVEVGGYEQTYTSFDGIAYGDDDEEYPLFSEKTVEFEGIDGIAKSNPKLLSFTPRARFRHFQTFSNFEVVSYLDFDGYFMYSRERNETGVGLANLTYPGQWQSAFVFTPRLEVNRTVALASGAALSGYVRGGVALSPQKSWSALTQFIAAPDGLDPIRIIEPFDQARFEVEAGLKLYCAQSGGNFQLNYGGAFGATTSQHSVRALLAYRFGGGASDAGSGAGNCL
ncbi:hypothetical protein EJC49_09070 [Aquibium carbonis]|uniref:Autotransporter domain-containing protein n=1 Tax=Aquibium carbonis TaxID=2495581 RepID=A0A3R9ZSR2_9HYPH|nr:hypothetical protein [Aquibium carbonis]RST86845.1 hypothetical protein EJC49_09070 [Aquibium carbonis]